MKLHWKMLTAIGLAIVCLNLTLFVASHFIILDSFSELEEQAALQNLERAVNSLQSDIDALSREATDEASWDATYAFIENGDRRYIDSDMVGLADTRQNLVLFTNVMGKVVHSKTYNFENETERPASQLLLDYMISNDRLWHHADPESHSEGVIMSPEGPMIIASRPILTSDGEGPVRGALILGRFLSPNEVERLAKKTSLSLVLDPGVQLFDLHGNNSFPSENSGMHVLPLDGKTLLGMALIRDIDGKPAFVLRTHLPRDIYRHGQKAIDYFLTWSLMVSLIIGLMSYWLLVRLSSSRQKLLQSEEMFRSIFESAGAGMSITSLDRRLLQVNPALCEFLGYSEEELLGRTVEEITHPDDRTVTVTNYAKLLKERYHALHYEKRYLRKDGQISWGHASVACVHNGERTPSYFVNLVQDLTDRKRAEEELDAFVYTVSHDLRTPLTPIIGYADFLREKWQDRLDEQGLDCLAEISESGEKMVALMEDLLNLAKVGQVEHPAKPSDTGEVVKEVVNALSALLSQTDMTVEVNHLPALLVPRTLLIQIFDNLIGNAIRYAGREGNPIEVGGNRHGDLVRLYVRDHGPGIPVEERRRIFEVFYRGATSKKSPGTGIGLATVQKIARRYGGQAWVDETEGGGSTFWVEMADIEPPAENKADTL